MSADMIELAAETLGCKGQTAAGQWLYRETPIVWWLVTDEDMAALGRLAYEDESGARARWHATTSAVEVNILSIVRDSEITSDTDLDALMSEAGQAGDTVTYLVLAHARADVLEVVRLNEEMDKAHYETLAAEDMAAERERLSQNGRGQ